jgi:hypothetical protein
MARIGRVDREVGLDARRALAEDDDAIGEEDRFLDVVGDEQRREA